MYFYFSICIVEEKMRFQRFENIVRIVWFRFYICHIMICNCGVYEINNVIQCFVLFLSFSWIKIVDVHSGFEDNVFVFIKIFFGCKHDEREFNGFRIWSHIFFDWIDEFSYVDACCFRFDNMISKYSIDQLANNTDLIRNKTFIMKNLFD